MGETIDPLMFYLLNTSVFPLMKFKNLRFLFIGIDDCIGQYVLSFIQIKSQPPAKLETCE